MSKLFCISAEDQSNGDRRCEMIGAGDGVGGPEQCWGRIDIPVGSFTMGCDDQTTCEPDESPAHRVQLSAYSLDRCEFTERRMVELRKARPGRFDRTGTTHCAPNEPLDALDSIFRFFSGAPAVGTCDMPLVDVTWEGANTICTALGGRLPTEAEWEYAARAVFAGKKKEYPTSIGTAVMDAHGDTLVHFNAKGRAAVGSYPPSDGLYDMAGNVWEWVSDWYGSYAADAVRDPKGVVDGEEKVVRGGSWKNRGFERYMRSSSRNAINPLHHSDKFGFRCAFSPRTP